MTDFLIEYGVFLAKNITVVIAILATVGGVIAIASKNKLKSKEKIDVIKLNEKYDDMQELLNDKTLEKSELKKFKKEQKKLNAEQKKLEKENPVPRSRLFVLEFIGDLRATAVANLREAITAILTVATPTDEVLVKIESSGGTIHGYGLAASQLKRIRDRKIPLTIAVDKVAASGGYMMACVADRIIAAPFAIIGSVGVIAQLPNFNRLLKKHDIEFEQIMAGQYKRTLSLFGENTKEGRHKLQQEIEEAHGLFKDFILLNRPMVDIEKIATGETWYGIKAKEMQLVDDLITSDDYLLSAKEKSNIFEVTCSIKKSLMERIGLSVESTLSKIFSW
jgi:serine protease SohB